MNDQCTMYVLPCSSEDEVILKADPHCIEAGESLREWREHWHKLYIVSYGGPRYVGILDTSVARTVPTVPPAAHCGDVYYVTTYLCNKSTSLMRTPLHVECSV